MYDNQGRDAIKKDLIKAVIFFLVAIVLLGVNTKILTPRYADLQTKIQSTASLTKKITELQQQAAGYTESLYSTGKVYNDLNTEKDKYISYMGNIIMANNLNINKMTVDDAKSDASQLATMKMVVELQGDLYNVKNLVQQMYDSETVCRINSFSYRLQDETGAMQWMWRSVDDQKLVPWWNLGLATEDVTAVPNEGMMTGNQLSADALMKHGTALCYLEVEFIGVGG